MKRAIQVLGLTVATAALVAAMPADTTRGPDGTTYGITVVDFQFQPATVTVRPGDVVRFLQTGIQPHNVDFRKVPRGVDLGDRKMGPFLVKKGDAYELRIDARFKPGVYEFVCTPHEMMGMKGRLIVAGG